MRAQRATVDGAQDGGQAGDEIDELAREWRRVGEALLANDPAAFDDLLATAKECAALQLYKSR